MTDAGCEVVDNETVIRRLEEARDAALVEEWLRDAKAMAEYYGWIYVISPIDAARALLFDKMSPEDRKIAEAD